MCESGKDGLDKKVSGMRVFIEEKAFRGYLPGKPWDVEESERERGR